MKSIYTDLDTLTRIDQKNKYTKQDYYISENSLLKITSLSPLKNGLFALIGFLFLIFGLGFLFEETLSQKSLSLIFLPVAFYCLFCRRELYIADGLVRRVAYIDFFNKKYVVWKSEYQLGDFSSSEIFWTTPDGKTTNEAQAHLTIYSNKLEKSLNVMHFLLDHDGRELLAEIILDIEKVIGLTIDVKKRKDYMGEY